MLPYPESLQSKLGNNLIITLLSNSLSIRTGFLFPELFFNRLFSQSGRPLFEPSPIHLGWKQDAQTGEPNTLPTPTLSPEEVTQTPSTAVNSPTGVTNSTDPSICLPTWIPETPCTRKKTVPTPKATGRYFLSNITALGECIIAIQCCHHLCAKDNQVQTSASKRSYESSLVCFRQN